MTIEDIEKLDAIVRQAKSISSRIDNARERLVFLQKPVTIEVYATSGGSETMSLFLSPASCMRISEMAESELRAEIDGLVKQLGEIQFPK